MGGIAFERLLERYGQTVTLIQGGKEQVVKAFVQPITDKEIEQRMPTEVGICRRDRFLYLGSPDKTIEARPGRQVVWNGQGYRVHRANPVYVGERVSHWHAVLTPEGGEQT